MRLPDPFSVISELLLGCELGVLNQYRLFCHYALALQCISLCVTLCVLQGKRVQALHHRGLICTAVLLFESILGARNGVLKTCLRGLLHLPHFISIVDKMQLWHVACHVPTSY